MFSDDDTNNNSHNVNLLREALGFFWHRNNKSDHNNNGVGGTQDPSSSYYYEEEDHESHFFSVENPKFLLSILCLSVTALGCILGSFFYVWLKQRAQRQRQQLWQLQGEGIPDERKQKWRQEVLRRLLAPVTMVR